MANLNPSPSTRFRPGRSGNPGGRPGGQSLAARLRQELATTDSTGQTKAERIAGKLIELAIAGDVQAIKIILDRTEGRAPLVVHHSELDVTKLTDQELMAIVTGDACLS